MTDRKTDRESHRQTDSDSGQPRTETQSSGQPSTAIAQAPHKRTHLNTHRKSAKPEDGYSHRRRLPLYSSIFASRRLGNPKVSGISRKQPALMPPTQSRTRQPGDVAASVRRKGACRRCIAIAAVDVSLAAWNQRNATGVPASARREHCASRTSGPIFIGVEFISIYPSINSRPLQPEHVCVPMIALMTAYRS